MIAYHFTADTLRGGRAIPLIGEWLVHLGDITPCESGLHASKHPLDALVFAPGNILHLVEIMGELVEHGNDKVVGRRRKILASIDATEILREFARWCATQVLYLWDAPEIVYEYLKTGDENKQEAASDAAEATAWSAWEAAGAARDASAAASAAAWAASDASASAWTARAAARAAAEATAWTASDAIGAARDAAEAAQREEFRRLVQAQFLELENQK